MIDYSKDFQRFSAAEAHYNDSCNLIKIDKIIFCTFFRISPVTFGW